MNKFLITFAGALLGILLIMQLRTQESVEVLASRDVRSDISHEIAILVSTNQSLRNEVETLEKQKNEYASKADTEEQLLSEIQKTEILAGYKKVEGSGVSVKISSQVTLAELTDILNEIFQLDTEAVALNGIRLTTKTTGLASYGGQIVLNGQFINPPFKIDIIGDQFLIKKALNKPDSTLMRVVNENPNQEVGIESGVITIDAIK